MKNWAAHTNLHQLLDDVQRRFWKSEEAGTGCSLRLSNVTGMYTLLVEDPNPEEVMKLQERTTSANSGN